MISLKTLINILIYLNTLLFTAVLAQEKPVYLVEDVQKKRTIIYVQNDTDSDKSVFLKINPIGYRRSAQRPIIKNIPANSKAQMLILIPFTDQESSYTYDLIVNKELENITANRQKKRPKKVPPQAASKHNLFVYTSQDCKRCNELLQKLENEKIAFLAVDIDGKNNLLSPIFWRKMKDQGYTRENIKLPFAKTNKKLFYPIEDFNEFIENLKPKENKGGIKVKRISLF